jgi:ABC-type glycerol-3-phosphate transport system permease component
MAARGRQELPRTLLYHAGVAALGFVMLYPILWLFASSFKGPAEIWADVMSLVPRRFSPENYVNGWAGFGGITFATFYKNSLIYAGVGTVAAVVSSAVIGASGSAACW